MSDNRQDGRVSASRTYMIAATCIVSQCLLSCPVLYLGMADPLQGIFLEVVGAWELETRIACPLCLSHHHLAAAPHTCSCINSGPWASCKTPCVCLPCMCQPCTKASVLHELERAGQCEVRASSRRQGLTY